MRWKSGRKSLPWEPCCRAYRFGWKPISVCPCRWKTVTLLLAKACGFGHEGLLLHGGLPRVAALSPAVARSSDLATTRVIRGAAVSGRKPLHLQGLQNSPIEILSILEKSGHSRNPISKAAINTYSK